MSLLLLGLLSLAAPAWAGQFDGIGIRNEIMAVGSYGGTRDGVRAWRRNAYGVDLDFKFTALFGPDPVHFGAGVRVLVGIGGEFSEVESDGLWWDLGMEATLQAGFGNEDAHLVLEGGWLWRRDKAMGEDFGRSRYHTPPAVLRLRGRASGWGGSFEWAMGRHLAASVERSIGERGHTWLVLRPEYVHYGFKVDEGVAPTYGTEGLKISLGVALVL